MSDRIAQVVVKQLIETEMEKIFLPDSYGYRPGKSALDAVGVTRERCWKYDWVLEFDIKGLFDNIDHVLLLKAVRKHVTCDWALLYIERWLTAPMEQKGVRMERTRGTPQGGVISPILANLFLHYTFDLWMKRTYPDLLWCRYADDGLVHCRTEREAEALKADLHARLAECHLELHPVKTRIVYCKDVKRNAEYPNVTFDFLGYCFRPRCGQEYPESSIILWIQPSGQPRSVEGHTVDDQELENSPTNATYAGGNRPPSQSTPAGMDRVLRTLYAFGVRAYLPARQLDAAALGATEI